MRIVNGYIQSVDPSDLPTTPGAHGHKKRAQGQPKRPQSLRSARSARARGGVQHDPEGMESGHTAHEESELTDLHRIEGHHPRMARKAAKRRGAATAAHDPEQEGEEQEELVEVREHDDRQDWRQRLIIQSGDHTGGEDGERDDQERRHDARHETAGGQRATGAKSDKSAQQPSVLPRRSAFAAPARDADLDWAQSVLLAQIAANQQPGASAGRLERQTRETMLRYLAQRVRKGRAADSTLPPGKLEVVRAQLIAERQRLRDRGIEPRPAAMLDEAQQRQFLLRPLKLLMLSSPGPRRHGNQAIAAIKSLLGDHRHAHRSNS